MRALLASCLLLSALGACELEPPPKKAPPAAPTPPPVADPTAAAPTPPPPTPPANPPPANPPPAIADGSGGGSALPPVSQACLDVSGHIADALIAEASDPTQKAAIEQEKTRIIRKSAEACTRDAWRPEVMKCFLDAKTTAEMQPCAKAIPAP